MGQKQSIKENTQEIQNTEGETKLEQIGACLFNVNLLIAFPINDAGIEDWAKYLDRKIPQLDINELEQIIDNYAMGVYEWDHTKGIQNITKHLEHVKRLLRKTMVY